MLKGLPWKQIHEYCMNIITPWICYVIWQEHFVGIMQLVSGSREQPQVDSQQGNRTLVLQWQRINFAKTTWMNLEANSSPVFKRSVTSSAFDSDNDILEFLSQEDIDEFLNLKWCYNEIKCLNTMEQAKCILLWGRAWIFGDQKAGCGRKNSRNNPPKISVPVDFQILN